MPRGVVDVGRSRSAAWLPGPVDEAGAAAAAVTLQQVLETVRLRGWFIAAVTALCLAGGVLFQVTSTPQYLSTAEVIIDPRELQTVNTSATPRTDNADATEAMVGNEMRVLKSNTLLSQLIDKEGLLHDPAFVRNPSVFGELRGLIDDRLGHTTRENADTRQARLAVLQALDQAIAVRRTERSFAIDVSVRTSDPDTSARLANSLVSLYIAQAGTQSAELNRRVGAALQDRLSELQARLRDADQRVEQFRIDNDLVSAGGVLTADQSLRALTDQLVAARARETQDRSRVSEMDGLRGSDAIAATPESVQSPAVAQIRSSLADALRRRAALARQLGPRHPDLLAADDQVNTLRHLLDQELTRLTQAARSEFGRSKQNAKALEQGVDSLSQSSLKKSMAIAKLRELEGEAEAARTLFTSFLSRSRELSEQTQIFTSNVRQIGTALPPLTRSNLSFKVVLAVALVLGLLLGTLLALLLDARARWFTATPGDFGPLR